MIYKNYARFIRFLNEYRNRYQNVMVAVSLPTVALFVGSTDDRAGARFHGFAEPASRLRLAPPLSVRLPNPTSMADAVGAYNAAHGPKSLATADAIFAAGARMGQSAAALILAETAQPLRRHATLTRVDLGFELIARDSG